MKRMLPFIALTLASVNAFADAAPRWVTTLYWVTVSIYWFCVVGGQ